MLVRSGMKKQNDTKKPLLVSVDKIRELNTAQLKSIAGGPCPGTRPGLD